MVTLCRASKKVARGPSSMKRMVQSSKSESSEANPASTTANPKATTAENPLFGLTNVNMQQSSQEMQEDLFFFGLLVRLFRQQEIILFLVVSPRLNLEMVTLGKAAKRVARGFTSAWKTTCTARSTTLKPSAVTNPIEATVIPSPFSVVKSEDQNSSQKNHNFDGYSAVFLVTVPLISKTLARGSSFSARHSTDSTKSETSRQLQGLAIPPRAFIFFSVMVALRRRQILYGSLLGRNTLSSVRSTTSEPNPVMSTANSVHGTKTASPFTFPDQILCIASHVSFDFDGSFHDLISKRLKTLQKITSTSKMVINQTSSCEV